MEHQEQHGTWISIGCSKTNVRAALQVCRLILQQAACSVSAQGTVSGAICPSLQPVTGSEALLQQPLALRQLLRGQCCLMCSPGSSGPAA